jgi:multidrug transporter EmrE-like cation transporter
VDKTWLAVLVTIGFSAFGVLGDYFLKRASLQDYPVKTWQFAVGFTVYASAAFGWLFVMRYLKLGTIGVVYSMSMIILLTLVGVLVFGESINKYEVLGIVLALAALALLIRHA